MNLSKLDEFHNTRVGYLVFGLVELAMAYGFIDWALDTGSVWWWIAAAFLLIGVLQNFGRFVLTFRTRKAQK
jgi:hypothetical protein